MKRRRLILAVALGAFAAALAVAFPSVYRMAQIATAFSAETPCSALFVSRRTDPATPTEDLRAYGSVPLGLVVIEVDRDQRAVTGRMFGLAERRAAYRDGLGCTLAIDASVAELQAAAPPAEPVPRPAVDASWPEGNRVTFAPNAALERALDGAFTEGDARTPRRTRAIVVVHRGRIVAERYAPGVGPETALPGWSMTKSVFGALAGILVGRGVWRLDAPPPLAAWRGPGDPRAAITLDQLLRMSSGLAFDENYGDPLSDVNVMLWGSRDAGAFAARKELAHEPGAHWNYSSGTTNVLSRAMRESLGRDYAAFPRLALFDRLGMASALIEPDASGTFVGSSLMFATARDWARFGLLFANDGKWHGERILPEGWVRYSATPAPAAPKGEYGAHWWLKLSRPGGAPAVQLPPDTFYAAGHGGQFVTVVPSRSLVIVRLGHSVPGGGWDQPGFDALVLEAIGS